MESIAKELHKIGSRAKETSHSRTVDQITNWLADAPAYLVNHLWLVIENDWIKCLVEEMEGDGTEENTFAPSVNKVSLLPQWFLNQVFQELLEKGSRHLELTSVMVRYMQKKQTKQQRCCLANAAAHLGDRSNNGHHTGTLQQQSLSKVV